MEQAVHFSTKKNTLFGILNTPDFNSRPETVILMVTGGPQTRVGSHRLYVQLSRYLENKGIASFRFDYEGTGDSEGPWKGYKYAGSSIQAAIDYLKTSITHLEKIIVWSLCDGATASLVFAAINPGEISSMILCNPYIFHQRGKAKTILKYYYINRFFEKSFWQKLFSLKFNFRESVSSFIDLTTQTDDKENMDDIIKDANFFGLEYEIMLDDIIGAIKNIDQKVVFLLSTNDLAAKHFEKLLRSRQMKKTLKKGHFSKRYIRGADHTFSDSKHNMEAFEQTLLAIENL